MSDILCCNLVNFSHRMESKVSFASVCAPELKKMIKTKWAKCFWTPCMMVTRRFSYIFAACTAQFGSLSSIHIKRSVDKFSCWSELCRRIVILFADHFASNRLETENNESILDKKIYVAENYSSHCEDHLFSLSTRSF